MSKNTKTLEYGGGALLLIGLTFFLVKSGLETFAIISGTLGAICSILFIRVAFMKTGEKDVFEYNLKSILKTYDAVLVQTKNVPSIDDKSVILVNKFEEMVDAQLEFRRPIYYKQLEDSVSFVLTDQGEALIYVLKVNDSVKTPLDKYLNGYDDTVLELKDDESNSQVTVVPTETMDPSKTNVLNEVIASVSAMEY